MVKFYFKPRRRRIHIKAKRYIPRKQKHALTFKIVCVFLILATLFVLLDIPIRPVVRENAKYIVKNEVALMINECVAGYLQENNIAYTDLITVSLNDKKEVTAVGTNTIAVNKLKTDITNAIANELKDSRGEKIRVSLGNLFDSYILDYIGIEFQVKLTDYGFIETDILSSFKSSGINQTIHRINLKIKVEINVNIGTLYQKETVETEILLVETVLLGNVPEMYIK
ncbi:MAG: sporulation protein YunB [Ruminococcaceae bacterium]|nr:sporulation protein YunB [Oscillospiraceae bacterium]